MIILKDLIAQLNYLASEGCAEAEVVIERHCNGTNYDAVPVLEENGHAMAYGDGKGSVVIHCGYKSSLPHVHQFIPCDDLPATCLCGKQEYE